MNTEKLLELIKTNRVRSVEYLVESDLIDTTVADQLKCVQCDYTEPRSGYLGEVFYGHNKFDDKYFWIEIMYYNNDEEDWLGCGLAEVSSRPKDIVIKKDE